ncbi:MAG: DUF433 domain-containing protein [Bacteroidota bacterium]
MTATPSILVDLSTLKLRLIEKITQLEDKALAGQLAEQLEVDIHTTDVAGIKRTPGVVGGRARIRDKRLPVWLLVDYRRLGKDESWFLRNYPGLTSQDLKNAWKYYELHKEEIDNDIRENDEEE